MTLFILLGSITKEKNQQVMTWSFLLDHVNRLGKKEPVYYEFLIDPKSLQ